MLTTDTNPLLTWDLFYAYKAWRDRGARGKRTQAPCPDEIAVCLSSLILWDEEMDAMEDRQVEEQEVPYEVNWGPRW